MSLKAKPDASKQVNSKPLRGLGKREKVSELVQNKEVKRRHNANNNKNKSSLLKNQTISNQLK